MRILVTGASGFVGSALCLHLTAQGHQILKLRRNDAPPNEPFDAIIHLAGEPLSFSRWSSKKQDLIRSSRVEGTQILISQLSHPPKIFISASAVGYYGDRGDEIVSEEDLPGNGFLSSVCVEWEEASQSLEKQGVRVVHTRFGMVLGREGGALKKLIPLTRWGLSAILGDGSQWVSWISLEDLVQGMDFVLKEETLQGAVNLVSPYPVRQEEFCLTLSHLLHRPVWWRIPRGLIEMGLGIMGKEMLLASTRVRPAKLLDTGFSFRYACLEDALKLILAR